MEQRRQRRLDLEPKQQPQTPTTKRKYEIWKQPSSQIHASNLAKVTEKITGGSIGKCKQKDNFQVESIQ